ncbi:MAG TPA: hypothetical protein VJ521_10770, partial [Acidobacteriota bacterium]|nr:hypothetical protein [Acidobacteriota bacterium]
SSVHAELEAMANEGLVTSREVGRALLFRKNDSYPGAKALKTLLGHQTPSYSKSVTDDEVRSSLANFGAPLAVYGKAMHELGLEETLALSLDLARRDATVARTLPVVFAKNSHRLDLSRLKFLARKGKVLPVLGLFLDVTASLTGSRNLRKEARGLMDRRRKRMEQFFVHRRPGKFENELTERNTPSVARKWRFLMNMGMDSFENLFRKNFPETEESRT